MNYLRSISQSMARQAVRLYIAPFLVLGMLVVAPAANAQSLTVFSPNGYSAYVNAPQTNDGGYVVVRNSLARSVGSSAYVTGVGVTHMPAYQAGDTLQWAVLARTTTGSSATLNIGVQSGSGDTNNLSMTGNLQVSDTFTWTVSPIVQVNFNKPLAYFWIPGVLGQEIQIKELVLGDRRLSLRIQDRI